MSTLSKRWKDAVGPDRKWPYRKLQKVEREIQRLMLNVDEQGFIPEDVEKELSAKFTERKNLISSVWIRV